MFYTWSIHVPETYGSILGAYERSDRTVHHRPISTLNEYTENCRRLDKRCVIIGLTRRILYVVTDSEGTNYTKEPEGTVFVV